MTKSNHEFILTYGYRGMESIMPRKHGMAAEVGRRGPEAKQADKITQDIKSK